MENMKKEKDVRYNVVACAFVLLVIGSIFAGAVSVSAEEGTTIFEDDFSALNLDNWIPFGSPSPRVLASVEGRNGVFDNNGDSWCDSGVVSKDNFSFPNGFTMESDIYVKVTNMAGCWDAAVIGLTKENTPYWDHPNCPGEGYYTGLVFSIVYVGDACWASPPEKRRHAYFRIGLYTEDGTGEGPGSYAINADDYINGWHNLKIVVGEDRFVSFYCDDNLIYKSEKRIHEDILLGKKIYLGQRSCGWSAGKAYHDYVKVYTGHTGRPQPNTAYSIENDKFNSYDIYFKWDNAPDEGCIFPAFQFWFEAHHNENENEANIAGYIGTQLHGTEKKAIFSIWDVWDVEKFPGKLHTTIPKSKNCEYFGGEGTGVSCKKLYNWERGKKYRLHVEKIESTEDGETWEGSIYDENNIKTPIGRIFLKNTHDNIQAYNGYGLLKNNPVTWVERFCGECYNQPYSKVTWEGPYANDFLYKAISAVPSYAPSCPFSNVFSTGYPYVTQESGDAVVQSKNSRKNIWPPKAVPTLMWYSSDIGYVRSIVVDDPDEDGTNEIVVGTLTGKGSNDIWHGYIYIFDALTHDLEWNSSDIGYVRKLKVADLNGDGKKDIIASVWYKGYGTGNHYGYIYVFDGLTHEQKWKSDNIGGQTIDLAIVDLDDDGVKEIITGGAHYYSCTIHGHVYVFNGSDFSQKWKSSDINRPHGIIIDDLDDDGVKEIIVGTMITDCAGGAYRGYIYVFNGLDFSQEWRSADIGIPSSFVVNDVDGDGIKELITGVKSTLTTDNGHIYVFDGKTHAQEWKSPNINYPVGLEVIDVDKDGTKEIITRTGMGHEGHTGHIYVFDGKSHDQEWKSDNIGVAYDLEVDDLDNDGTNEILTRIRNTSNGSLCTFNGITHKKEWQSSDIGTGTSTVADMDNNGWMEILAGGSTEAYQGYLYIFGVSVPSEEKIFDTGTPSNPYPSIMGTHKGVIKPSDNITISKLYTYPCAGTGGHTKSIELYENDTLIASGTWDGYQSDWHNITIHNVSGAPYVILLKGQEYNYTIRTGSYPQIIHEQEYDEATGGTITCTLFTDVNGKTYTDWIPAIRLE